VREGDKFPVAKLREQEEGMILEDAEQELELGDKDEDNAFKAARLGDNFMCPFQCDICHFRNMKGVDPSGHSSRDKSLLIAIRRANIDAFWGRASSTVAGNFRDLKKFKSIGLEQLGLVDILPNMGPFPLKDIWGMSIAVVTLHRSLDPGRNGEHVQFSTARRLRSVYSNLWGSSIHSMTKGVMAKDTSKTYVTKCPTYCLWFERFVKGMHSRMGDDSRPDAAISVELMISIMNRVNVDFIEASDDASKLFISRAGLMFMSAFLGSLRGEEVPRLLRKYFISLNKESMTRTVSPHVVLPLFGKFKGEQGVPSCYIRRVVLVTKSGLNMERWVRRSMTLEASSNTKYLFANSKGTKEKAGKYEDYFHAKLEIIQKEEDGLVPRSVKVRDIYGIGRGFRRGSVTAATNAPNTECSDADIVRNNRWRKEERAGTKLASLDMLHHYTDTLHSVNADLKFSRCL
jgi:hypothetical protein